MLREEAVTRREADISGKGAARAEVLPNVVA